MLGRRPPVNERGGTLPDAAGRAAPTAEGGQRTGTHVRTPDVWIDVRRVGASRMCGWIQDVAGGAGGCEAARCALRRWARDSACKDCDTRVRSGKRVWESGMAAEGVKAGVKGGAGMQGRLG
eukprot:351139-Chlamydomonas_euryale.AAC.1